MKIALLGAAGFTGHAAAAELARRDEVGELILVDYIIRDAKRLAKALSPKCRWAMADVGKPQELTRLLEGVDAVATCVGPCAEYEKTVLLTCASCRVAAASIGFGALSAEDRGEIDAAFRAGDSPAVAGCGWMPGWTDLLSSHFLEPGGVRYLFFSPDRFGGYTFLRGITKGIEGDATAPPGSPAGRYFRMTDGSLVGVPEGKPGKRLGRLMGTLGNLGPLGEEFSAALLLWTRGSMTGPPGGPAAVAGVAAGGRSARLEDPKGTLGAVLLAETAVRLARRPYKPAGLLSLPELIGRQAAEAIATDAGARILAT